MQMSMSSESSPVINYTTADSYHCLFWVAAQFPGCDISFSFPLQKPTREFGDSSAGMSTCINMYWEGCESKEVAAFLLFSHQMQPCS